MILLRHGVRGETALLLIDVQFIHVQLSSTSLAHIHGDFVDVLSGPVVQISLLFEELMLLYPTCTLMKSTGALMKPTGAVAGQLRC